MTVRTRTVAAGLLQLVAGILLVVGAALAVKWALGRAPARPGWTVLRPPHEVSALAVQGDVIWAGGRDGLVSVDRRIARLLPEPATQPDFRYVRDLLVDSRQALWVAHAGGVARLEQDVWRDYTQADGLPAGAAMAFVELGDGTLWIGTERGVVRFDGRSFAPVAGPDQLGFLPVDVLFQDRDGVTWVGSSSPTDGGLASYDGRTWRTYSTRDGLPHKSVNQLLQDHQGTLWAATGFGTRGGACRRERDRWGPLAFSGRLAGVKIRSIFEDREERLWFGSEYDGIAVSDPAGWRLLTPKDGLAGWEVKEMLQDRDGAYWLGTESGLSRIALFEGPAGTPEGGR